jgi:hypothetical protein
MIIMNFMWVRSGFYADEDCFGIHGDWAGLWDGYTG